MQTNRQTLLREGLVVIIRGARKQDVLDLGKALYAGHVRALEVTFNQSNPDTDKETAEAIAVLREHLPDEVLVGAGTVVSSRQLELAANSGAQFIISPHTDPALIAQTKERGLVSMPGALTPSECVQAHAAGADFVKIFPAAALGPSYLKALRAPLNHIPLFAVGGIDEHNIPAFVAAGVSGFGVGGSLITKALKNRDYDAVSAAAARYAALIQSCREESK